MSLHRSWVQCASSRFKNPRAVVGTAPNPNAPEERDWLELYLANCPIDKLQWAIAVLLHVLLDLCFLWFAGGWIQKRKETNQDGLSSAPPIQTTMRRGPCH
eukprot:3526450-Amphidinium_carterae.1